jgi:5-methylcytosine-specific restriction endonuclease McrA
MKPVFSARKKPFTVTRNGVSRIKRDSYGPQWFTLAAEVRKRDNYTCCHPGCGLKENPKEKIYHHVHHIVPLSRGGTSTKGNLITLCEKHHEQRHKHMR